MSVPSSEVIRVGYFFFFLYILLSANERRESAHDSDAARGNKIADLLIVRSAAAAVVRRRRSHAGELAIVSRHVSGRRYNRRLIAPIDDNDTTRRTPRDGCRYYYTNDLPPLPPRPNVVRVYIIILLLLLLLCYRAETTAAYCCACDGDRARKIKVEKKIKIKGFSSPAISTAGVRFSRTWWRPESSLSPAATAKRHRIVLRRVSPTTWRFALNLKFKNNTFSIINIEYILRVRTRITSSDTVSDQLSDTKYDLGFPSGAHCRLPK